MDEHATEPSAPERQKSALSVSPPRARTRQPGTPAPGPEWGSSTPMGTLPMPEIALRQGGKDTLASAPWFDEPTVPVAAAEIAPSPQGMSWGGSLMAFAGLGSLSMFIAVVIWSAAHG